MKKNVILSSIVFLIDRILKIIVEKFLELEKSPRYKKMAALMAADGLPVDYEQMHERFGEVIGRPHFARVLVELGLAETVNEAFDKYV